MEALLVVIAAGRAFGSVCVQECTNASGFIPHTRMDHSNKATCVLPRYEVMWLREAAGHRSASLLSDKQEKQPEIEQGSTVMTNTRLCTHTGAGVRAAAGQGSTDVAALLQTRACGTARITSQTRVSGPEQCDKGPMFAGR